MLHRKGDASIDQADPIVVPTCLRAQILRQYHTLPVSAHPGRKRTFDLVSRRWWWRGMSQDVAKWVKACRCCAIRKPPRHANNGDPSVVCKVTKPWHTLAIDLNFSIQRTLHKNVRNVPRRRTNWASNMHRKPLHTSDQYQDVPPGRCLHEQHARLLICDVCRYMTVSTRKSSVKKSPRKWQKK